MTKITTDDIKHIAKLSNLPLSAKEEEDLAAAFSKTIEYINVLEELDTTNVEPTFQVAGLRNVFQSINSRTTLKKEEALKNATNRIKDKFGTKAVFDR